jgi:RNA polymerase sigma-70 factor, ECF subfamily
VDAGVAMTRTGQDLSADLARVATGDRAAFARVYDATAAKVYGVVLRILKRRDVTDEIVQEVYVKIWQRAGDFDATRASPITWMVTIARNRALDEVRKVAHAALEETPEAYQVADAGPGAFDLLSAAEDHARLVRCLGGLEPAKADMVRLAYLEGLSREALSARFGHPVATIKTWLHRSLKQLKDCLGS